MLTKRCISSSSSSSESGWTSMRRACWIQYLGSESARLLCCRSLETNGSSGARKDPLRDGLDAALASCTTVEATCTPSESDQGKLCMSCGTLSCRVERNLTHPRRRDSSSLGQHANVHVAQLPKLMQTGMIRWRMYSRRIQLAAD